MFVKAVLDIAENCDNPFDYFEVVSECKKTGVQVPSSHSFAMAMGHATVGKIIFPETNSLYEAWERHVHTPIISKEDKPPIFKPPAIQEVYSSASNGPSSDCGGCGGKVPEQSRGLGDTVYKITHATGLDKLAELYTKITGKDCGCASRQEALNKLFPYGVKESE